jgi:hydroxyacylglutathione hydrolase
MDSTLIFKVTEIRMVRRRDIRMPYEIKTIATGIVNCYLLKTETGFVLIDTGISFQRGALKKALKQAGCKPGDLKLVVITHADFDHAGNCVWLRKKYGAPVAIHREEVEAVETGRMLRNRKSRWKISSRVMIYLAGLLIFRRFKPDIVVTDGDDLSGYGMDGRILHVPGHSRGSIGVLTKDGDFFCGDLLVNTGRPRKNSLHDDLGEMDTSIEKVKSLSVKAVYPGHGRPFKMEELDVES